MIVPERDLDGGERRQDPKHVAVGVFLDHPRVFDAASDLLALAGRLSPAEYGGIEERIEPVLTDATKDAFEKAAAVMFEADHPGSYCRIAWYTDADEINLVITHGSMITTTPVVDAGVERVISYRAAEDAVLSYAAGTGRLKIGGVSKTRRAAVAELFADRMLKRPGFFAAQDSQNLYTLAAIERVGCGPTFNHVFDPGIRQVQIIEVQVNRLVVDERTGQVRVDWSSMVSDRRDNALRRVARVMNGESSARSGASTTSSSGALRPTQVPVKIKPPASAIFKRHRFEERIMTLLRRNGLVHERDAG